MVNWTHFNVNKSQQIATAIYYICIRMENCFVAAAVTKLRATADRQVKKQIVFGFGYCGSGPSTKQQTGQKKKSISNECEEVEKRKNCVFCASALLGLVTTNNKCVLHTAAVHVFQWVAGILFYFCDFVWHCMQSSVSIIKSLRLT